MKNYFYSLFIIILISSCKKEEEIILTAIELDKNEISLQVNEESTLSIDNYYPGIPKNYSIKWSSSDSNIVSVKNGIVRGESQGKAFVYAQIGEVISPSCFITVDGVYDENNDIYIVGSNGNIVTYWKNGTPVPITDGKNNAQGLSIFILNNDVYVAGYENNIGFPIAKYWKNGEETVLSEHISKASDIIISGNDIYNVGYETNSDGVYIATIWKNGITTPLSDGTNFTVANSVSISNSDVYVAGFSIIYENKNHYYIAKYWKNGEEISLTNQSVAEAHAIEVHGDDIFVAGNEFEQGISVAKYWENGEEFILSNKGTNSFARSIAISDNDVYVAGFIFDEFLNDYVATYWKNGLEIKLSQSKLLGEICDITISGNDIYILANVSQDEAYFTSKYWKNGKEIAFTKYQDNPYVCDIKVVPKNK